MQGWNELYAAFETSKLILLVLYYYSYPYKCKCGTQFGTPNFQSDRLWNKFITQANSIIQITYKGQIVISLIAIKYVNQYCTCQWI